MSSFEAQRMKDIPFSNIRSVFEQVDSMRAQGHDVVPFHIGRPDFDTPEHIKEAAKRALDRGATRYTSNYGLPELRHALAEKLARDNGLIVDPETQIVVTVGANEAVLMAMLGTLNPGDEVLIPEPMWLHYFYCARLAGARVVSVPLSASNGYQLDPDDLAHRITDHTRMVVLNSPHNPTGVVFTRETIEAVADVAARHGLLVLSDEIYEKIIYDGSTHVSPATLASIREQTITIGGFSKLYAMTGWRLGYVVAPSNLIDVLVRVHQYTTICATSFAQAGAVAALTGPQDDVHRMIDAFRARRRAVVDAIEALPQASLVTPMGAFYAFPDVSALGLGSDEVARQLLQRAGIAVVPGSAFGTSGEGYVRIAYSCGLPDVERGMKRFQAYWRETLHR